MSCLTKNHRPSASSLCKIQHIRKNDTERNQHDLVVLSKGGEIFPDEVIL